MEHEYMKMGITMDRLHYRQNFLKCRDSKIHYHSIKERPNFSKIAKFGCKML